MASKPRPNDVLLGRGSGPNHFEGNKQYRRLADERKVEYAAAVKHKEKQRIAKELRNHIHSLGGRFLQLSQNKIPEGCSIVEDGIWYEADESTSLEKCRQSLREKRHQPSRKSKKRPAKEKPQKQQGEKHEKPDASASSEVIAELDPLTLDGADIPGSSLIPVGFRVEAPSSSWLDGGGAPSRLTSISSLLPSTLAGHSGVDSRLQLMQPTPALQSLQRNHNPQSSQFIMSPPVETHSDGSRLEQMELAHSMNDDVVASLQQYVTNNEQSSQPQDPLHLLEQSVGPRCHRANASLADCSLISKEQDQAEYIMECEDSDYTPLPIESESPAPEDAPEHLLSILGLSDRATMTEEEEQVEHAAMKDEERAAALSDMFGEMCTVGIWPQKRARRDLDGDSIAFLVQQMRLELERIPNDKKQALLEAQLKCHPDEFSDERMVMFLRCEGMNAKVRLYGKLHPPPSFIICKA